MAIKKLALEIPIPRLASEAMDDRFGDEALTAGLVAAEAWGAAVRKNLRAGRPAFGMVDGRIVRLNPDGSTEPVTSDDVAEAAKRCQTASDR